jgi:hypothetical protein
VYIYVREKFVTVGNVEWSSDRLSLCPTFRSLSAVDVARFLEGENVTVGSPRKIKCYKGGKPEGKCQVEENGSKCGAEHSLMLNG